ncbi:hypothetical protein H0H81_007060 [Sphagnurus paluster]|uniref:Aminoglycoside phosphotransferase domain-containing protein n=1 Tax=Sphagnurus paluster TaxID=117069 RepID=A0A9P7K3H0_9AGAR|nr:hypothetical protein H0H81_007060 [Sphagnurus paluster]
MRHSLIRYLGMTRPSRDPSLFFKYTGGRWFENETWNQQQRTVKFDIDALKGAAISSVPGAKNVVKMTKLPEGAYNKVFSIILDNQKEVVARIPTPLAGPPQIVTASEVATMKFARERLGVPVPRVLSWSSDSSATAVGAEFIIMEKAPGIEVGKVWHKLSMELRLRLVQAVVDIEHAALVSPLPSYGSIFFRDDIKPGVSSVAIDETYAIGPCMDRSFWNAERATMKIDRGPWSTTEQCLSAVFNREYQWISQHASSQPLDAFRHHPAITRDPAAHLAVLDMFKALIPHIIPTSPPEITQSTLWHHDLHGGNIFICESELAEGRISISSVIDWQSTTAMPLYMQARVPQFFCYHSPWDLPSGVDKPVEPVRTEEMTDAEYKAAWEDWLAKQRVRGYRLFNMVSTPYYCDALTDEKTLLFAELVEAASTVWGRRFHMLRDRLALLYYSWSSLSSMPFPVPITKDDVDSWYVVRREWEVRRDEMKELCRQIGIDTDGWCPAEDFDVTLQRYNITKELWTEMGNAEADWPFSGPAADSGSKAGRLVRLFRKLYTSSST